MDTELNKREQRRYERARKRVKDMQEFYQHLTVYITMNIFFIIVDLITGSGFWFYWISLAWGIGLAIHWGMVFGPFTHFWDPEWEERKIAELMGEKVKHDEAYFEES